MADIRKRDLIGQGAREGKILTISQELLQGYWREGGTLSD